MAYKSRLKTRLDRAIEELDNSVYVVEENGKKVNDYSIEPVRVDFFDYHYSNSKTRLSITADYVNDNTRQCFKPNIIIDENAFKEFEKAEEKLIELRKENN
jgi:hypothetical protein